MDASRSDAQHMRRALRLAARGRGRVSPNPMVGAVIVDDAGRKRRRTLHFLMREPSLAFELLNKYAKFRHQELLKAGKPPPPDAPGHVDVLHQR